jgi:hypothetical protein
MVQVRQRASLPSLLECVSVVCPDIGDPDGSSDRPSNEHRVASHVAATKETSSPKPSRTASAVVSAKVVFPCPSWPDECQQGNAPVFEQLHDL